MYPNEVINGYCKIGDHEEPESVNIPKVIFNERSADGLHVSTV